ASCYTNSPVSSSGAEKILEMRYNKKFSVVSDNTSDEGTGNIIFRDSDGIEFTVNISTTGNMEKTYHCYEHYISAYYNAHPELFDIFSTDGHNFAIDGNEYIMYFDGFDNIEETVRFTCSVVGNMPDIIKKSDISLLYYENIDIVLKPSDCEYEWYYYPRVSVPNYVGDYACDPESLIKELQEIYISELRDNDDMEKLSGLTNEQLYISPVQHIYNITYNDEIVIKQMNFLDSTKYYRSGKNACYGVSDSIKHAEKDGCFKGDIYEIVKLAGWKFENADGKDLILSKNKDILKIHIYKTDRKNNYDGFWYGAEVTFNGKPYQLDGGIDVVSKERIPQYSNDQYNICLTFSEKDFREIFGIEFEFDMLNETGRITSIS
ncbi:MAG: hypothetical protein K2J40_02470, partial [Ruminococcus sp.]|nr:hypothetical protein [Ruminococcus sp.]